MDCVLVNPQEGQAIQKAPMAGKGILIVEDDILVALDMEATMGVLGHVSVRIAANCPTALLPVDQKPDLPLVGLNLRDGLT